MASAVTDNNKVQSMVLFPKSPVNPISDFAAIIKSDVPTACFIGSLLSITSAGIIKNPPPAPTRPVSIPTSAPSTNMSG